jgi:Ca-activated chloride channel family protein
MLREVNFLHPTLLWLLLVIPLLMAWLFWRRKKQHAYIRVPVIYDFGMANITAKLQPLQWVLRLAALALVIVALARPQSTDLSTQTRGTEGIDIALAVDISSSMLAKDLQPNRIEALKAVGQKFVDARPVDRLALIIYAGESFAQVPLTTDHGIVKKAISELHYDMLQDGTAIGMGLATAVNRLKDSESKSKVIILLTDGENNTGIIDPKTATELAKQYNIRVYTIGLGTTGNALSPASYDPTTGRIIYSMQPVNIDEDLLKYIAKETNGMYFRATDNGSLEKVYAEIDQLEKSKLEELTYYQYQEHFYILVFIALGLIGMEILLRLTLFRSML